ncbi:iron-dependent peroxidase [Cohnella terricola]|uniref:Iron-dependent peroxidase n=1 Tax=Cohnella terricola TaxID=1289167 RepID=A0A559J5C8_9BACL|nr:iron-dependent peroxidase [Cohnella terricola]TVX95090.1 iron-dependent peroxidase [Cohnella terricola]
MGLNYIWDLMIKANNSGIAKRDIRFAQASVYSPYMELSLENMNALTVEREIEINPYYRFDSIFDGLFHPNYEGDMELRQQLFDIIVHFLADMDLTQGMNKREFYIRFVLRDMENGVFGENVKKQIMTFTREERDIVAVNLLQLYESGEALHLLKDTMRKIFKRSTIYVNCDSSDKLLFYIGQEETAQSRAKVELIRNIFLPVRFSTELYWVHHFGIIGVEDTMRMDRTALI